MDTALQAGLGQSLADSAHLDVTGTDVSHEGPGFVMAADITEGVKFEVQMEKQEADAGDGEQVSLTIEAPSGAGDADTQDGLVVTSDTERATQTVVQPVDSGVRVMHVISNRSAPLEYETRFSADLKIDPVFVHSRVFLHDIAGRIPGPTGDSLGCGLCRNTCPDDL